MKNAKIDRFIIDKYPLVKGNATDIIDRLENVNVVTIRTDNDALGEALAYVCLRELNKEALKDG